MMGQYLQAGICYSIKVRKKEIENNRVNFEEVKDGLKKEILLDLYEINEVESGYIFSLKQDVLENEDLVKFLSEQYELLNIDEKEQIINELKVLSNANDIIELAESKRYVNFQHSSIYDYIYCTKWNYRVMVEYELIIFMLEGKIVMESYRCFLKYVENLIIKNNAYKLNGAVKVLIG